MYSSFNKRKKDVFSYKVVMSEWIMANSRKSLYIITIVKRSARKLRIMAQRLALPTASGFGPLILLIAEGLEIVAPSSRLEPVGGAAGFRFPLTAVAHFIALRRADVGVRLNAGSRRRHGQQHEHSSQQQCSVLWESHT